MGPPAAESAAAAATNRSRGVMAPSRKGLLTCLKLADLSVVAASFVVADAATRGQIDFGGWLELLQMRIQLKNVLFVAAYLGLWHFVLKRCNLYRSYRLSAAARELRDVG